MICAISVLHSLNPPLVHGHLTPHNLFIEEGKVLVGDIGLDSLKKYAGLFGGYKNKSAYTAPELLNSKGNAVTGQSPVSDIYSLGFIIWEIYAKTEPFKVTEKELKDYIVEGDFRPQMPENIPAQMSKMIRSCWQKDATQRPKIEELVMLSKHLE